ncbi:gephyrin-like molybdotransferase Glp [Desulforamulus aeronauticus]|uniref:Molybdopterin molybdenumtransferase n=1 Tax=Desulforamulus aeronauticus DSM 10349 TaxID=1121421 RepID=A0A1M6PNM7_9FIRM|nr:gephyrin-like molybdotransferase Glp [Desulforamulus aeronauticus]SHK09546.1 molybdopterin molybdotransferase [Desulforamulus aeronauticus DSM 10349]
MYRDIPLEEAVAILMKYTKPIGFDEIDIIDALGRVLNENIITSFSLPPFNRSPLDGYAVIAEDTISASKEQPILLRVNQNIFAGDLPLRPIVSGEAAAIATGAPIPPGANAVIKIEDTQLVEDNVLLFSQLKPGDNFINQGDDVPAGEQILSKGMLITPAVIGLLASLGRKTVKVFKRPKVAALSIGDELVGIDEPRAPGKIYNSNLYAISAQITEAGGVPVPYRNTVDDKNQIAFLLDSCLQENDMVITTGGVSVGKRDYVKESITLSGANTLFWKVNIKPGTPVVCGEKNGRLIVGLSGNPAAAMITFYMLIRPVLQKISGLQQVNLPHVTAIMEEPFTKKSKQRRMMRANVYWKNGYYHAVPSGTQSPGALKSMLQCNALIDIPGGKGPLNIGEEVKVILLSPNYIL